MALRITNPKEQPALFYDQLFLDYFAITQKSPTGAKTAGGVVPVEEVTPK